MNLKMRTKKYSEIKVSSQCLTISLFSIRFQCLILNIHSNKPTLTLKLILLICQHFSQNNNLLIISWCLNQLKILTKKLIMWLLQEKLGKFPDKWINNILNSFLIKINSNNSRLWILLIMDFHFKQLITLHKNNSNNNITPLLLYQDIKIYNQYLINKLNNLLQASILWFSIIL